MTIKKTLRFAMLQNKQSEALSVRFLNRKKEKTCLRDELERVSSPENTRAAQCLRSLQEHAHYLSGC